REALVDRRRMDVDAGGPEALARGTAGARRHRAHDRVAVRHAPGEARDRPPVAVTRELTADAADRLSEDDRRRDGVRAAEPGDAVAAEEERDGERPADEPAVEHEATGADQVADRRA